MIRAWPGRGSLGRLLVNELLQGTALVDAMREVMSTERALTAKEILAALPSRHGLLRAFAASGRAEELALAAIRQRALEQLSAVVSFKYVDATREPMVVEPTYRLPK